MQFSCCAYDIVFSQYLHGIRANSAKPFSFFYERFIGCLSFKILIRPSQIEEGDGFSSRTLLVRVCKALVLLLPVDILFPSLIFLCVSISFTDSNAVVNLPPFLLWMNPRKTKALAVHRLQPTQLSYARDASSNGFSTCF